MVEKNFTLADFSKNPLSPAQSATIKGGFRESSGIIYISRQKEGLRSWDGIDIRNNVPVAPQGAMESIPALSER